MANAVQTGNERRVRAGAVVDCAELCRTMRGARTSIQVPSACNTRMLLWRVTGRR